MSLAAYASKTNERKKCTLNGRLVENSFHRVSHVKSARHLLKTMTRFFRRSHRSFACLVDVYYQCDYLIYFKIYCSSAINFCMYNSIIPYCNN